MNEYAYYRFVNTDPFRKLVTIKAWPTCDEYGPIGDPDLFVTNKFEGLVGVTKEDYVWKSTNVGSDRIDIHPLDPNNRGSGTGTYTIGVYGYRDRNEFDLSLTFSDPDPIQEIQPGCKAEFQLVADKYTYFCMKLTLLGFDTH